MRKLEDDKKSIRSAIQNAEQAKLSLKSLPDVIPGPVDASREIVERMTDIACDPHARTSGIQAARKQLHALLGPVVLEPRDGVL